MPEILPSEWVYSIVRIKPCTGIDQRAVAEFVQQQALHLEQFDPLVAGPEPIEWSSISQKQRACDH